MKIQTLRVLAAVATPLIATASASAGFLGVKATSKPNDFGLLIVNVYANTQVALSGFHIPAPAVISLLGVAGLVTLRRRR